MKLWRIYQTVNNGYDTYDSAVVAAETEQEAQCIHPSNEKSEYFLYNYWAHPKDVKVVYLGEAAPHVQAGVICASFNAG